MLIRLPRNLEIDTDNVPNDFDEIIRNTFRDYTEGTRKEYRYHDKLCFIDECVKLLHRANNSYDAVKNLILAITEYELDEYGNFPNKEDFFSTEFMEECYELGQNDMKMYSKYYTERECIQNNDKHLNDTIMKLLERVIKVVINYEE